MRHRMLLSHFAVAEAMAAFSRFVQEKILPFGQASNFGHIRHHLCAVSLDQKNAPQVLNAKPGRR